MFPTFCRTNDGWRCGLTMTMFNSHIGTSLPWQRPTVSGRLIIQRRSKRKYMTCVDANVCMFPNIMFNVKLNQTEIPSFFLWNPSCFLRPRMLFRVSLGKKILWDLDLISCSAWNRAKPLHWWHLSTSVARCLGIDLVVSFRMLDGSHKVTTQSHWSDVMNFETFKICIDYRWI